MTEVASLVLFFSSASLVTYLWEREVGISFQNSQQRTSLLWCVFSYLFLLFQEVITSNTDIHHSSQYSLRQCWVLNSFPWCLHVYENLLCAHIHAHTPIYIHVYDVCINVHSHTKTSTNYTYTSKFDSNSIRQLYLVTSFTECKALKTTWSLAHGSSPGLLEYSWNTDG